MEILEGVLSQVGNRASKCPNVVSSPLAESWTVGHRNACQFRRFKGASGCEGTAYYEVTLQTSMRLQTNEYFVRSAYVHETRRVPNGRKEGSYRIWVTTAPSSLISTS